MYTHSTIIQKFIFFTHGENIKNTFHLPLLLESVGKSFLGAFCKFILYSVCFFFRYYWLTHHALQIDRLKSRMSIIHLKAKYLVASQNYGGKDIF